MTDPRFYNNDELQALGYHGPTSLDSYYAWLSITNNQQAAAIMVLVEKLEALFGSTSLAQSIADGVAAVVDVEPDEKK